MRNKTEKNKIKISSTEVSDRVKRGQCALTHPQKNEGVIAKKCVSEVADGDNKNQNQTHKERR